LLRLGYNTNGFNCHSLEAALDIISEIGYRGVAITIDNYILNPGDPDLTRNLEQSKAILKKKSLACVIETGARFLLDPRRKHEPTLIAPDAAGRQIRINFLKRALDIAARLEAEAFSFWAGIRQKGVTEAEAWNWLTAGCRQILSYDEQYNIPLAFEPEPGMFIENLTQYQTLKQLLDHPLWGLTLDLGHAFLTEAAGPAACIRQFKDDIKNIHAEDMRRSAHEHLQFGEGEMDFSGIFKALKEINYTGLVNVELSRHSRDAVTAAQRAFEYLTNLI
jgi:L-ribulose-5-phosphate 3-epimerase